MECTPSQTSRWLPALPLCTRLESLLLAFITHLIPSESAFYGHRVTFQRLLVYQEKQELLGHGHSDFQE